MSIWAATGWAAGRAGVVALVACLLGALVVRLLQSPGAPARNRALWGVMLATLLMPAIVVGYTYAQTSLALVRYPLLGEAWYALLLIFRLTPVAAIALTFAPPAPVSDAAAHCYALLPASAKTWRTRAAMLLSGRARNRIIAAAVVFLLALQEFEIASLMARPTWTVWLYDAQPGGLPLSTTLRYAAVPVLIELAVLAPLLWMLVRQAKLSRMTEAEAAPQAPPGIVVRVAAWAVVVASAAAVVVVPAFIIISQTLRGYRGLQQQNLLLSEIGYSLLFAGCAGLLAWWAADRLVHRIMRSGSSAPSRAVAIAAAIPGLLGSLVVGLLLLRLVIAIGSRTLADSILPTVTAVALLLLPIAMLLHVLLAVRTPGSAVYQARLLGQTHASGLVRRSRELLWHMQRRPRFWVLLLLVFLAFFDLAASALLHPPSMMPVSLMLYNQMHYGHIPVLFTMVGFVVLTPLVLVCIAAAAQGVFVRYFWLRR